MKRIMGCVLMALVSITSNLLAALGEERKEISYYNDTDNVLMLDISREEGDSSPVGAGIAPHSSLTLPISGRIEELIIAELKDDQVIKQEAIFARAKAEWDPKKDVETLTGAYPIEIYRVYDKDETLNGDDHYLITHNRINPSRAFRVLNSKEANIRKGDFLQAVKNR